MSLTEHEPKVHRSYDGTHVNIASSINRFRLGRETEHGINRIMKASLRAQITHHKAFHGLLRNPTVRWHNYEAKHVNSIVIGCMYH